MSEKLRSSLVDGMMRVVAGRKQFVSLALMVLVPLIGAAPAAWSYQCAWEQLHTFTGNSTDDQLGHSVSGAGDVNNDGYDDLIVGAPYNDAGGTNAGRAYVYFGQTGGLIWTFTGEAAGDMFGYSVSRAGDVNDDGYDDVIVGARENNAGGSDAGRAYVYSGQTGALLWTLTGEATDDHFGTSVSGAGDVNNDGHDDLIVGASGNDVGASNAGRAYVYSGQTGAVLWTFTGEAGGDAFGGSVSGAGDVNNDGYDDLIVGASGNDAGGGSAGRAYVYSGQTGGLLWTFTGGGTLYLLGASVSGAGDVNNDGHSDLIVGVPWAASFNGRAYVYSGETGDLLWSFSGEVDENLGWSVSGAGDVNDDGHDDLIVGAWQSDAGGDGAGRAYVYSGQTGDRLHTFTGEAAEDYFGMSVSGAGDVNDDGIADLIVGAYRNDAGGTDAGRAYVFSGRTEVLCFTGEAEGYQLGYSVSGAGDVNNDGYDDVVVGVPFSDRLTTDAGYMWVYSGLTGNFLVGGASASAGDQFGYSVSGAGDVNNDGKDDWIVGMPFNDAGGSGAGKAKVYLGPFGNPSWNFVGDAAGDWLGISVSGAGDYDGDGYDDVVVGAPHSDAGSPDGGQIYVYSGLTGGTLISIVAMNDDDHLGQSVSGAGDINNDGYDEVIMGAPGNDDAGQDAGSAWCWSQGSLLWTTTGEAAGDEFGYSVSGAGDVNNDGYDDFIVGAPFNDAAGSNSGRAYVYSGPSGDLLYTFPGQAPHNWFGWSVSGAGDVNNDGYDDLIVGAPHNDAVGVNAGRAYVFCGQTGALLCIFTGEASLDRMGYSVSGAGDVDNDGYDEVIVGARKNDTGGNDAGRAYVFGCPTYATHICGDANGDGIINVGDIVYLVSYLYKSGPAPVPDCVGDVNCDDIVNIGDVVYLVSYLYKGGYSPSPYCCIELIEGCQGFAGR